MQLTFAQFHWLGDVVVEFGLKIMSTSIFVNSVAHATMLYNRPKKYH